MIADRRSNADLTEFLRARRAQLRRADRGLPSGIRSDATLSQGDVAELAGVSRQWYLAFESGRLERPTLRFLERIAAALRLDAPDIELLLRLAVRGTLALPASPRVEPDAAVLDAMLPIRDFARRSAVASDVGEIASLGCEAAARALGAAFGYCAIIERVEIATFVDATSRGRAMIGLQDCADHSFARELAAGRTAVCEDAARSDVPVVELFHRITGGRSVLSTSLVLAGRPVGLVGVAFDDARPFTTGEIAVIETVRAIGELALAGR